MIHSIKRYFVIRSYMRGLSGELVRRFGDRANYKITHVNQAIQRGGYSPAFVAYAHAAFCSENDFNAQYRTLGVGCGYLDLRRIIARRYFSGHLDFDAHTIFNRQGRAKYFSDGFYESDEGSNDSGSHHYSGGH